MSNKIIAVDAARLPILLTELRLPTFSRMWPSCGATIRDEKRSHPVCRAIPSIAETADAESLAVSNRR